MPEWSRTGNRSYRWGGAVGHWFRHLIGWYPARLHRVVLANGCEYLYTACAECGLPRFLAHAAVCEGCGRNVGA